MDELDHSNAGSLGKNEFWALFRVATDEVNQELGYHDGQSMTYDQFTENFERSIDQTGDGRIDAKEL